MFNITNFEKSIETVILKRGKDYFLNGNVAELEENESVWTAEVDGTESYNVEVSINKNLEVARYFCDCPYDGMICKHTVAVFYAIRKELDKTMPLIPKKNVFETILQKTSASEFQDFIRSYTIKNKKFKTEFELYFSEKDDRIDIEAKYSDLFKKITRKYTNQGFIDYRSTNGYSNEVNKLIDTGFKYIENNNVKDAFLLVKAILYPLTETIEYSDDSNGSIGSSIENAIELLDKIVEKPNIAFDMKEQVFNFTRNELNKKIYFDYGDFGDGLLSVFKKLAIHLNKSNVFIEYIDQEVAKLIGKYDNYRKESLQKLKIQFLQELGRNDEAENVILQNMDIVEVRMNEVKKAISKEDYNTAKKLISEGIKIAENKSHSGTVSQWNMELLQIAVLEKDITIVRHFTKHFAFDRGFSKEYYNQWKATFNEEDWKNEIESHIVQTVEKITKKWKQNYKNDYWHPKNPPIISSELPSIYITEGYLDRLLALVQIANNLDTTLNYHSELIKKFPTELLNIYIPTLENYGLKVSDRSGYADLVNKMKRVIKDIPEGKQDILSVARSLKERFSTKPRRPAMIEELDKILK